MRPFPRRLALLCSVGVAAALSLGCARKEKVLDVEAPGFNLEVERSTDGREITIDSDGPDSGTTIDVDATRKDGDGVDVDVNRTN
jgi:hypothetical protein